MSQTPIASINKIAKDIRPPHQQNVANVRHAERLVERKGGGGKFQVGRINVRCYKV